VSSWGGYVFLINLIPIHVFVLMICGRYSHRVYVAYSTVYALGTILSMQISFVGFQPVQTSEHMLVRMFRGFIYSENQWVDTNPSNIRFSPTDIRFTSPNGITLMTYGCLYMDVRRC
jgi:dolichyl-diphosphooligosaccharide--protein glycosyltransferase